MAKSILKRSDYLSNEEYWMVVWLEEAKEAGYVFDYKYEPKSFVLSEPLKMPYKKQLKTKAKKEEAHLLNGCSYTPDFIIEWDLSARGIFLLNEGETVHSRPFFYCALPSTDVSVIDVKGTFIASNQSSAVTFATRQKWMWQKHRIYVQKVMPLHKSTGLFAKTFTPKLYLKTDTGKKRKIHWKARSIEEFVNDRTV
jgi:hypothetical protein